MKNYLKNALAGTAVAAMMIASMAFVAAPASAAERATAETATSETATLDGSANAKELECTSGSDGTLCVLTVGCISVWNYTNSGGHSFGGTLLDMDCVNAAA